MKTIVFFLFAFTATSNLFGYRILSREVDRCGAPNWFLGKEQCAYTNKQLVTYEFPDGSTKVGWAIKCSSGGNNGCPRMLEAGDLDDPIDLTTANELVNYSDQQINNGFIQGSYSLQVVTPSGDLRLYSISWHYTVHGNGEISLVQNVDRLQ